MSDFNALMADIPAKRDLLQAIDRLAIPADAKAILGTLAGVTMDVGSAVVQAGRRILAFILDTVRMFPNTAFGLVAGLVVSSLVAAIPLLGVVLGPLLAPLLIAFGLGVGALADIKDGAIRGRVQRLEAEFRSVTANG